MDRCLPAQIAREIPGSIKTAPVFDTILDQFQIGMTVDIKRRNSQIAFGTLWFLLHFQNEIFIIDSYHARSLQGLKGMFIIAHDDAASLLLEEVDKSLQAEVQNIIRGNDKIIIAAVIPDCKDKIPDGSNPMVIVNRAIINDRNSFFQTCSLLPITEKPEELMIRHNHMLTDLVYGVNVLKQVIQNGFPLYLQQRFGEIFRKRIHPCRVSGS